MALTKVYAYSMPTLRERVIGIQKMIDEKLEELRLKKHGFEEVYFRMVISHNLYDYFLQEKLRSAYEGAGWRVSFSQSPEGTEIILI